MSTRARPFRRAIAFIATLVTVASGLTVIEIAAPITPAQTAEASPPASAWDPGLIITDSVMFDSGTMATAQIQSFLNAKGANCVAHKNTDGSTTPCLKNYKESTYTIKAVANRCTSDYKGAKKESAATIIYKVARACGINPKVLIVLLQKEQGLVTASGSGLTPSRYAYATGFACPDTAKCNTHKAGFFRQLYSAAYGFNNYVNNSYYSQYPAFKTSKIQYKPNSSCKTQSVYIKSRATHALYVYTPYVPNASALAHPYAVGDSCSSYGNRNFWLYFNDWFGSPITGTYLVDTSASNAYLVMAGVRYSIPGGDAAAKSGVYKGLGSIGRVSSAYIASLTDGGTLGRVMKTVSGSTTTYWLLTSSGRVQLSGSAQAASYGIAAAKLPTMTDDFLRYFPVTGFTDGSTKYIVDAGKRYSVPNSALAAALAPAGGYPKTTDTALTKLPLGGSIGVANGSTSGTFWVIAPAGKYLVSSCSVLTSLGYDCAKSVALSSAVLGKVPTLTTIVATNGTLSLIINGKRWTAPRSGLAATLSTLAAPVSVSTAFSSSLPSAGTFDHVAYTVNSKSVKQYWFIDGKQKVAMTAAQLADLGYGTTGAVPFTAAMAAAYTTGPSLSSSLIVGSSRFHLVAGATSKDPDTRRQVLNAASAKAAGVTYPASSSLTLSADAARLLPYGAPYVATGSVFTSNGSAYASTSKGLYRFAPTLSAVVPVVKWLGGSDGALDAASAALLPSSIGFDGVYRAASNGRTYLLTTTGPVQLTATSTWPNGVITLGSDLTASFPAPSSTVYKDSFIVGDVTTGVYFYVREGVRHPVRNASDAQRLQKALKLASVPKIADSSIPRLGARKTTVLVPGSVWKSSNTSTTYWFIDGLSHKRHVSAAAAQTLTGSSTVPVATRADLDSYSPVSKKATTGVICGSKYYLSVDGTLHPISVKNSVKWRIGFTSVDSTVCASSKTGSKIGVLMKHGSTYYHIVKGKKVHISAANYASRIKAKYIPAVTVDAAFARLVPTKH